MVDIFSSIKQLVLAGEIAISEHGYDEMVDDDIFIKDIMATVQSAEVLEVYPEYHKGPCVLVLHYDVKGNPVHVVWGIPLGQRKPAVLITAYRPDPDKWSEDFRKRL